MLWQSEVSQVPGFPRQFQPTDVLRRPAGSPEAFGWKVCHVVLSREAEVELCPERRSLAVAVTLRISRAEQHGRKQQAKLSSIQSSTEDGDCSLCEVEFHGRYCSPT